ncbi:MAG: iron-containing redox enzyme family protein [Rouxiella badensis]|uniref:iron-containing redox enzyme family protein n=1 Tax=Rouxiella badensis TaxID=1646377 RepID=UPI00301E4670
MFNLKEVKSTFESDTYNFSSRLKHYINSSIEEVNGDIDNDIDAILYDAYETSLPEAQKVIHNALFMIYQINLCYPLSIPAQRQYDPIIINIKNKIEARWLYHEFKDTPNLEVPAKNKSFAELLINLWKTHNASHHPLFDFIETDATQEQLYLFLKSDSALNLIFFDLVAYTLIGSHPETRGTISENIWDEVGHGDRYFTHVNLYKDLLERRGINLPTHHYVELYGAEALSGHNAFMLGGVNRRHYYKLLGVMAMTEVLDPPQYSKLVKGCTRLGLTERDFHYYAEHIEVDIKHGDDWLYNVINVIVSQHPESKNEFYLGCLLRLRTAERYYDQLLEAMKGIPDCQTILAPSTSI